VSDERAVACDDVDTSAGTPLADAAHAAADRRTAAGPRARQACRSQGAPRREPHEQLLACHLSVVDAPSAGRHTQTCAPLRGIRARRAFTTERGPPRGTEHGQLSDRPGIGVRVRHLRWRIRRRGERHVHGEQRLAGVAVIEAQRTAERLQPHQWRPEGQAVPKAVPQAEPDIRARPLRLVPVLVPARARDA
jgi:hypothetical protein